MRSYPHWASILHALRQYLAARLGDDIILTACRTTGHPWCDPGRLTPAAILHWFLIQVRYGNTALTHVSIRAGRAFCQERARHPWLSSGRSFAAWSGHCSVGSAHPETGADEMAPRPWHDEMARLGRRCWGECRRLCFRRCRQAVRMGTPALPGIRIGFSLPNLIVSSHVSGPLPAISVPDRSRNPLALARLVPGPRPARPCGSPRIGPAPKAHRHPGEDRPAVVARQPLGARVRYRTVDGLSSQVQRGAHRQKVSFAAALWLSPRLVVGRSSGSDRPSRSSRLRRRPQRPRPGTPGEAGGGDRRIPHDVSTPAQLCEGPLQSWQRPEKRGKLEEAIPQFRSAVRDAGLLRAGEDLRRRPGGFGFPALPAQGSSQTTRGRKNHSRDAGLIPSDSNLRREVDAIEGVFWVLYGTRLRRCI